MKTITAFVALLVFIQLRIAAQIPPVVQWQKSLGGSYIDESRSICKSFDGGFLMTGFTLSSDGNINVARAGNGWIAKLNSVGDIDWQLFVDADIQVASLCKDSGYFVAGSKLMLGNATQTYSYDYFLMKIDKTGNVLWQHTYGGSNIDYGQAGYATSDDGFVMAGYTQSNDGDVTRINGGTNFDYWIVKLDKDGNLQWQKTLGGDGYEAAFDIKQTKDNNYIIAGRSNSNNGDVKANHSDNEFWVVQLDAEGNLTWQNTYGGNKSDIATRIVMSNDGGFIIGGYSNSTDGDVTSNHGNADVLVIKINAQGKLIWSKSMGGSLDDDSWAMKGTLDGNFVIAAISGSKDFDLANARHSANECWIVKMNTDGNILWQNTYGGNFSDGVYDIINTSDENYILAGNSFSNDGDVSGHHGSNLWDDAWIAQLSPATTLPVNFAGITAVKQQQDVRIQWKVANETNIKNYDVQRSFNGIDFSKIATVSAVSNSSLAYSTIDKNILALTNATRIFYRILATGNSGEKIYSSIASVNVDGQTISISIIKQTGNSLSVEVNNFEGIADILVFDNSGKIIFNQKQNVKAGNITTITLPDSASGIYYLMFNAEGTVIKQKFFKQ